MGFTLFDALQETTKLYHLKVLAGKNVLEDTSISWVHSVEDTNIIKRFWGNELAVTTGLGCDTNEQLMKVIELLVQHKAAGLIINIGAYIKTVPQDIISYCEENRFPLLTVPWEIYIADMIKDYCFRIFQVQQDEKEMSEAFMEIIRSPRKIDRYGDILQNTYDIDGTFQVACIYLENRESFDFIQAKQADYYLHTIFETLMYPYSFFKNAEYYILIVNKITDDKMNEICNHLAKVYNKTTKGLTIRTGIGTNQLGVINVAESYKRAKAAMRMSIYLKKEIVSFEDMGIFQIFFTIEDTTIMKNFSENTLKVLSDYDLMHQSNYLETLYYFLKHDGSIQAIANEMFMHRNTINYRLNKIKELLNNDLETPESRFPYQMAFYIKEIMKNSSLS